MNNLFWLSKSQLNTIKPYFPPSRGVPRVDDLRVISGIIHVLKRGLQWRDAPKEYGPHKTLYNRKRPANYIYAVRSLAAIMCPSFNATPRAHHDCKPEQETSQSQALV